VADDQTPEPDNVTPLSAARKPGLSKTATKRLLNASLARVHQETSADRKARAELGYVRQQLHNACAVLEAVVRRHGPQVFDRADLEGACKDGNIVWDVAATRITLRLKPDAS